MGPSSGKQGKGGIHEDHVIKTRQFWYDPHWTQHYLTLPSPRRVPRWKGVMWLLWLWLPQNQISLLGKRQDTDWTVKRKRLLLSYIFILRRDADTLQTTQLLLSSAVPDSCHKISVLWLLCVDAFRIVYWKNNPRFKFWKTCYEGNTVFPSMECCQNYWENGFQEMQHWILVQHLICKTVVVSSPSS